MDKKKNLYNNKTEKLALLAFLASFVVIFQFASYFIKLGSFPLSLVLVPISIGGMFLGIGSAAFLGFVFGLVCLIAGFFGLDSGTLVLIQINPLYVSLIAISKGILCGIVSSFSFKLLSKLNFTAATVISSVITPVINTGMFFVLAVCFYKETLQSWAGGTNSLIGIFSALILWNFIFELILNIIICPIIAKIIYNSKRLTK